MGTRPRHQQLRWAHDVQRFHGRHAMGRDGCRSADKHRPPRHRLCSKRPRTRLGSGRPGTRVGRWIRSHHHVDPPVELRVGGWLSNDSEQNRVRQQLDDRRRHLGVGTGRTEPRRRTANPHEDRFTGPSVGPHRIESQGARRHGEIRRHVGSNSGLHTSQGGMSDNGRLGVGWLATVAVVP